MTLFQHLSAWWWACKSEHGKHANHCMHYTGTILASRNPTCMKTDQENDKETCCRCHAVSFHETDYGW